MEAKVISQKKIGEEPVTRERKTERGMSERRKDGTKRQARSPAKKSIEGRRPSARERQERPWKKKRKGGKGRRKTGRSKTE